MGPGHSLTGGWGWGGGWEWGQGVLVEKTITRDMEVWGRAWSPGCLEGPGGVRQGHGSSLGVKPGSWRSLGAESTRGVLCSAGKATHTD